MDYKVGEREKGWREEKGTVDRSSVIGGEQDFGWVAVVALRLWLQPAVLSVSMHIGRLTKVKTLYSIMTEKQRKTAYKIRT